MLGNGYIEISFKNFFFKWGPASTAKGERQFFLNQSSFSLNKTIRRVQIQKTNVGFLKPSYSSSSWIMVNKNLIFSNNEALIMLSNHNSKLKKRIYDQQ